MFGGSIRMLIADRFSMVWFLEQPGDDAYIYIPK